MRTRSLFVIVLVGTAAAQAPFHIRYDWPGADVALSRSAAPMVDGGAIIGLQLGPGERLGLLRTAEDGTPQWAKRYTSVPEIPAWFYSVGPWDPAGLFLMGMIGEAPYNDVLIVRTDPSGAPVWTNRYDIGPAAFDYERLGAVATTDGGLMVYASRETEVDLFKVGTDGQVLWSQHLNLSADGTTYCGIAACAADAEGGAVCTGFTYGAAYAIHLDIDGEVL